jgi:1-acyl-sn-glycerol-3-phosphate acyltransferase
VRSGLPLLPICHNSGKYWKNKKLIKSSGEVILKIGNPISGNDPKIITEQAFNWTKETYQQMG